MRKNYKSFSIIFTSLLLASFCVIFQTQATLTSGVQTVDSTRFVGTYSSLALDSNNNPHISYKDSTYGGLKYASWNGSSWDIQIVDSEGDGMHSSLALDSNNNPHISYWDATNNDLEYASWSGSGWIIQRVDTESAGTFTSLALDSSDNPHISYHAGGDLKYANYDGSAWHTETIDSVGVFWDSSLALDSSGNPHIGYYDLRNGYLKYATSSSSIWRIEIVDSAGEWGIDVSLALDSNNNPHISYGGNGDLKYAKSSRSIWNIETLDWNIETVDSSDVGSDCSLALDSSDNPHISYYDASNGDLRYAKWIGSGWDLRIIDSEGNVGLFTSLALDSSGKAYISYYDSTNSDLKYAEVVDPASFPTPPTSPSPTPSPTPTPSPSSTTSETIYINYDGSVEGTDKIQQDGATYTFTDNIEGSIVVRRNNPSQSDNIIIDGAGYTLQGNGSGIGIDISNRYRVTVKNVSIRQFHTGIYYTHGAGAAVIHKNRILGNIISNCSIGIRLHAAQAAILRNNTIVDNKHNFFLSGAYRFHLDHDVDSSNTVNNKPIYYLVNRQNMEVPHDAGTVILVNCSNITVRNLRLSNNGAGVYFIFTTDSTIINNIVQNNNYGIYLWNSQNNVVNGNNIKANKEGILIAGESKSNKLRNNSLEGNENNLNLVFSSNLATNEIDESNTVNGKPVYYWINRRDMEVPPDAGYVALINCTGITVRNQNLSNNNIGILLASTINSMIANSTFSSNTYGIYCTGSGNTITGNTVKNNPSIGIFISSSSNTLTGNYITASSTGISFNLGFGNTIVGNQIVENAVGMRFMTHAYDDCARDNLIYHNNFINNDQNVYNMHLIFSPDPINIWDNGTIGNYWDDYNETDANGDGVGDSPYVIDANNQDNYPLMAPIPEFPSWASMLLILIVLTVAIAIYKRRLLKTPIH